MTLSAVTTAPDGTPVLQLTLGCDGLTATLLSFGAVLQDLRLSGHPHPLVLGYPDAAAYFANPNYFGATVGRFANRIRDGRANIDGRPVRLDRNSSAGHHLHGGRDGTAHQNWAVIDHADDFATMAITLPDRHMGFPGCLEAQVTYRVQPRGLLQIDITATTDAPTLCSFAHHSYFNLDGSATISDHEVRLNAARYLPIDHAAVPLGRRDQVQETRFDLRRPTALGDDAIFDHTFCLAPRPSFRQAAWLGAGGLGLEVSTDAPGLQLYTGDHISAAGPAGWGGRAYGPRAGVALEPQIWPDAPNHAGFPSAELFPGQTYRQRSQFQVSRRG